MTPRDHAWYLQTLGFFSVPCAVSYNGAGKSVQPFVEWVTDGYQERVLSGTITDADLEKVWAGNEDAPGLAMIIPRGYLVLDPDTPDAEEFVYGLKLPRTVAWKSRRGIKHLYRYDGSVPDKITVSPRVGLEIRLPGSLLILPPTPPYYEYLPSQGFEDNPTIPMAPGNVVALLKDGAKKSAAKLSMPEEPLTTGEGRHELLLSYAAKFAGAGITEPTELFTMVWALNEAKCDPPYDEEHVRDEVSWVLNKENGKPEGESEGNKDLFRRAGKLHRAGAKGEALRIALLAANQARPEPLPISTVDEVCRAAETWEDKPQPGTSPEWQQRIGEIDAEEAAVPIAGEIHPSEIIAIARRAEKIGNLRIGPGAVLYAWVDGNYVPVGDRWVKAFVRMATGDEFRLRKAQEITAYLQAAPLEKDLPVSQSTDFVNLRNGLLYLTEEEPVFTGHSPSVGSFIQLPVAWDPVAECKRFDAFLERVLPADCIEFMWEWLGYLLVPTWKYQVAVMLHGPGNTGKSTLLNVIEALLGPENISSHSLRDLAENRFAKADLFGKLANTNADLDAAAPKNAGLLKELISGDRQMAERKYGHAFSFSNTARLMFSANEIPGTTDVTSAYFRRWRVIPMRNVINDVDPLFAEKLTTDAELSGILFKAVEGLKRLEARRAFLVPGSMEREMKAYRMRSDTVLGFVEDGCVFDLDVRERRGVLYSGYRDWCGLNGRMSLSESRFKERLEEAYLGRVEAGQLHGYPDWKGIKLRGFGDGPPGTQVRVGDPNFTTSYNDEKVYKPPSPTLTQGSAEKAEPPFKNGGLREAGGAAEAAAGVTYEVMVGDVIRGRFVEHANAEAEVARLVALGAAARLRQVAPQVAPQVA